MHKLLLPLLLAALNSPPVMAQANVAANHAASPAASAAEPTGPLSLASVLDLAMRASPEIAVASREVEARDGNVRQAGIIPNPSLEASVEDIRERSTRTTMVQLNLPVELGGKRSARIAAAEHGREAALAELAAKRAEVRAAVIAAFHELLIAQERHRLMQASFELAQRATNAAAKRVMTGKISPVEETRARVAEANARAELAMAASEMQIARRRLAATWGSVNPRFTQAEDQSDVLPVLPALDEIRRRLQQAPGLARARIEVERRQALVQVERSKQMPDVTLSVGTKRDEQLGRSQTIVGMSIPLPLFDRNQGNVQEAMSRSYQARDELAAATVRLDSELAQSHARLQAARQEAELFRKEILPGAQSAYEAAGKGFDYGKFSFLDVLDAQRTLFQARSQYLRSLSDARKAAADIDRILGEPSPVNQH